MPVLRENYWVIKCRKSVRQILRQCVKCYGHPPASSCASVPEERVIDFLVFKTTSINLFSLIHFKDNTKTWAMLFTYVDYRALHVASKNEPFSVNLKTTTQY